MAKANFWASGEFWLAVIRIVKGNPWNYAGVVLIVGGVATVKSVFQYLIAPVAARFDINVTIPDTPLWASLLLIFLGIAMMVANRLISEPQPAPYPHDIDLLRRFRKLIGPHSVRFLAEHSFRHALRCDQLDPFETLSDVWNTSHYEFQNKELQATFEELRAETTRFNNLTDLMLFTDDRSPNILTTMRPADRYVLTKETKANIDELNAAARSLSDSMNNFERLARRKIPTA